MANDLVLIGIEERINDLKKNKDFHFPVNYSPENALKSAWLMLQNVVDKDKRQALTVCTKESIQNAIFDMVIQGLSPAKKQCYFVVYGNQLSLMRSYFGTMAVTKRCSSVQDILPQVVYEGDKFEYGIINGILTIKEHIPNLDNIDNKKIKAVYCIIVDKKGVPNAFIMTLKQIYQAWAQSKAYPFDDKGILKNSSVQAKFTDQMAMKTVISRACKHYLNTSDDSDLFVEAVNRTTENEFVENRAEEIHEDPINKILKSKAEEKQAVEIVIEKPDEGTTVLDAEKSKEGQETTAVAFHTLPFTSLKVMGMVAGVRVQGTEFHPAVFYSNGDFDHDIPGQPALYSLEACEKWFADKKEDFSKE